MWELEADFNIPSRNSLTVLRQVILVQNILVSVTFT